ncbi:hypothetical protein HANVADRAFT_1208 [Hanseniaspora valbyensis NRRL Y-1626]|uniref:Uncharacterized protein n=1 Tax=Hanseniaspora valbyensis NRRL Y-1626 TaxID=766949 RepID=A0A1B7THA2_9ASCO|nr:hypothetical protein HANVADRAFT_1208 [Hanseniaspora valbyensis NRRL Y-1626]
MRSAPKGRRYSNRKNIKRYRNKIKKYLSWYTFLINKYNLKKFTFSNKFYEFKQNFRRNDLLSKTNKLNQLNEKTPWYKILFYKIFKVKKKDLPLVIVSISHFTYSQRNNTKIEEGKGNDVLNSFVSKKTELKIEYVNKNKWNTLMLSNREQKIKKINSQQYQDACNKGNLIDTFLNTSENENFKTDNPQTFKSLNQIEQKHILSQKIPTSKLDVKYNFYYGTNALKTICIPLISATPTTSLTSSSNNSQNISNNNSPTRPPAIITNSNTSSTDSINFLEINNKLSIRLPKDVYLKTPEEQIFNTHLRKKIRLKFHDLKNKTSVSNINKKDEKISIEEQVSAFRIKTSHNASKKHNFDPF